ncbi:hypothetical protein MMYC01_201360 [Madurella mycetomatis]|uniref:Clr5 domain-containing protein n=1 Tax=Madurella mycetomatis TaxID=100816 RepID=A0A175WFX0_9PEZI|nr:hypothetical protein MMYC01_201360 [Madurella mycetomatis]
MDIASLLPRSEDDKFLNEHLKPVIIQLYLGNYGPNGKSMTIGQVVAFMRDNYAFHGAESQYRRWFRQWGVRKRTLTSEKNDIVNALGKRPGPETSTSNVKLSYDDFDKTVDKKQMRRYLSDKIRHHTAEPMSPGVLSSWILPYAAYSRAFGKRPGHPSPFATTGATPTYLSIPSPEAATPGRQAAGPSPTMQLVRQKAAQDRSSLLQGRFEELLASCGNEDRAAVTDYLHDFYIHSFVTAKYWEAASSNEQCLFDVHDPRSWNQWAQEEMDDPQMSFARTMKESVTQSTFSHTLPEDLPISTQMISQSVQQDPGLLRVDACKIAIMAGNTKLLFSLLEEADRKDLERIGEIYPFHLAAAFLDGGNTCCAVFTELYYLDPLTTASRALDNLGHTILDALMISILRSHTNVSPEHVSRSFNPPNRFPGEEKDICGRWDADSPILRALFRRGYARIPTRWKHGFCHTSVQAVCHSIIAVYGPPASPKINALSGLFIRRCNNCGRELKLGPLHTLVVVAFYLAHQGMPGETMFGPLAILVCLLSLGADASLSAMISVEDILGNAHSGTCHHNPMTACDLMEAVPPPLLDTWSSECQTGWLCILQVLRMHNGDRGDQLQETSDDPLFRESIDDLDSDMDPEDHHNALADARECALENQLFHECLVKMHEEWLKWPRGTPKLGLLWATIQVEFLTYRRIQARDPWISDKFSMTALRSWLEGRSLTFRTPLVDENLMRQYSACCGWFLRCQEFACPTAEDVCTQYFMNMDIYSRATYLDAGILTKYWMEFYTEEEDY